MTLSTKQQAWMYVDVGVRDKCGQKHGNQSQVSSLCARACFNPYLSLLSAAPMLRVRKQAKLQLLS